MQIPRGTEMQAGMRLEKCCGPKEASESSGVFEATEVFVSKACMLSVSGLWLDLGRLLHTHAGCGCPLGLFRAFLEEMACCLIPCSRGYCDWAGFLSWGGGLAGGHLAQLLCLGAGMV